MNQHLALTSADSARQLMNLIALPASLAVAVGSLGHVNDVDGVGGTLLAAAPGAVFIWLPLFAWTLLYAVWQALPAQRESPLLRTVGWWTASAAAGSAVATLCLQRDPWRAPNVVVAGLCTVAVVFALLQVERGSRGVVGDEQGMVRAPFGLHLGWTCVAALLHGAQVLDHWLPAARVSGIDPIVAIVVAIASLVVVSWAGIALVLLRQNRWAGVAIAWGLGAIAVQREDVPSIAFLAWVGAVVVVVALLASLFVFAEPQGQSS
ncbi:MAG: hypothetical protein Q8O67_01470 [Deltaproteobacteria bacterium]|nr:hypothetical protein [Deltaproteobacteria bacterium]